MGIPFGIPWAAFLPFPISLYLFFFLPPHMHPEGCHPSSLLFPHSPGNTSVEVPRNRYNGLLFTTGRYRTHSPPAGR